MNGNDILLAKIGAPHGIKGEVRVKPFGDPQMLDQYGRLRDDSGRKFKITRMRAQKNVLVVKFEGINTRNEAEALNGVDLYVSRDNLPELADEDEFYINDLAGLEVRNPDSQVIGKVVSIQNFGAGDLIEITPNNGGETYYLAFTRETVPKIDLQEGWLQINPPPETIGDKPGTNQKEESR